MVEAQAPVIIGAGHLAIELRKIFGTPAMPASCIVHAVEADPDWCESDPKGALRELVFDAIVVRNQHPDARFIYVSSGCVWTGPYDRHDPRPEAPFMPESPVSPKSVHGYVRLLAEHMLRGPRTAILRPRLVYSASDHPGNALRKFMKFEKLIDIPQSMTSVQTIADTITALINGQLAWGRVNCVYDRGTMTPYQIGVHYLYKARKRQEPGILKSDDRKPERVHVVMEDPDFERTVKPASALARIEQYVREMA